MQESTNGVRHEGELVGLPSLHPSQMRVIEGRALCNVVACGRRWGKTTLAMHLATQAALDGLPVAWSAPHCKYLDDAARSACGALGHAGKKVGDGKRIETVTGGSIDFWPLSDKNAGHGRKYALWIVDDAAMVDGLEEIVEQAIRPALADMAGELWLLSTPQGRGYFHDAFLLGQSSERGWASWQEPTISNPHIRSEDVDLAKDMMMESAFRQEYLADFLIDADRSGR